MERFYAMVDRIEEWMLSWLWPKSWPGRKRRNWSMAVVALTTLLCFAGFLWTLNYMLEHAR